MQLLLRAFRLQCRYCSFRCFCSGGRLADKRNRKNVIVICDLVTVVCYIICGLIPLSAYSIGLFYVASVFATIEGPSYDALIADLSDGEDREKAYSPSSISE